MPGKFLKGAFVQFSEAMLLPVPNVILFQYNPETITHAWTPATAAEQGGDKGALSDPLAVSSFPGESFSFRLQLDANDQIAEGNPLAAAVGIGPRIAALEMLVFPTGGFAPELTGSVSVTASPSGGSFDASATMTERSVPASVVPTVLFVWGPGRILPVRVVSLSIEEQLWDEALTPMHAEVQVALAVLTPDELIAARNTEDPLAVVGQGAYIHTHAARRTLALANQANTVESIIGMLPI